jgi:chemotaxis protein histidine kinase CheA
VLIQNRVALDRPSKSLLIGVESANQQRRVMVDEVIGKQEVVIKSP